MKILCVSDQFENSAESLIEGVFRGPLREKCDVYVVFFSKSLSSPVLNGYDITVPYRTKKKGIVSAVSSLVDLSSFDIVLVRNFFPVLSQFLKAKERFAFKLGFWNTFPHSFRRYFEAQKGGHGQFRKSAEFFFKNLMEIRLVQKCHFLVVMSKAFKEEFFEKIDLDCHYLPMGFDENLIPVADRAQKGPGDGRKRFIYTGAVDRLRQIELIARAFATLEEDFQFDIYTASENEWVEKIREIEDPRISVYQAIPRDQLFGRMAEYDVGVGLIPENRLYKVSSPTKTVEYYSLGLPAIVSHLPEYEALLSDDVAFFCSFNFEDIKRALRKALHTEGATLVKMGEIGRGRIGKERNYGKIAQDFHGFLLRMIGSAAP